MQPDYHEIRELCFWEAQARYEAIRPILLNSNYSLKSRARETNLHYNTLKKYLKSFAENGFTGLEDSRANPWNKGQNNIPEEIRTVIYRLKAHSSNISVFEIQKYISNEYDIALNYTTLQRWVESLSTESFPNNSVRRPESSYEKKVEAVKLRKKGLSVKTIAQWVGTSVSTVKRTLSKFKQTKSLAALEPRHTESLVPKRIFNFQNLHRVRLLQKQFPQTGSWRITEMLKAEGFHWGRSTVANMMQFNRKHYLDPPQKQTYPAKIPNPGYRHQYWFVDVRYLTVYERRKTYSICVLEGYSRKILAGEATRRQNLFTLLKVLYPAVKQYGAPHYFVSDNAKVFTCQTFLNVLAHLKVVSHPIDQGKPWQNLIEAFFGIEKRMLDPIVSEAQSFTELELLHREFLDYYNTSSHYAHRNRIDNRHTPSDVLTWVRGQNVSPSQMIRAFEGLVIERQLTHMGYARVHNFYLFICVGFPGKTVRITITETRIKVEMDGQTTARFECELLSNQELKRVWNPEYSLESIPQRQLSLFEPEDPVWPSHFRGRRKKHRSQPKSEPQQLKIPFEDLEGWDVS